MDRPDNDEYFMDMALLVATRSTCIRRHVGAVLVKDKRVLSTGYNGSPKGTEHCEVLGCIREQMKVPSGTRHELCRGVHAEQNAIIQAAYFGVSVKVIHYAVYEHRNSDNLIVLISETKTINTPTPDQMFNGRGKYDYNKSFSCGKIMECAKFILDDMSDVLADNYVKRATDKK